MDHRSLKVLDILVQSCECLSSKNLILNWSAVKDKGYGSEGEKKGFVGVKT